MSVRCSKGIAPKRLTFSATCAFTMIKCGLMRISRSMKKQSSFLRCSWRLSCRRRCFPSILRSMPGRSAVFHAPGAIRALRAINPPTAIMYGSAFGNPAARQAKGVLSSLNYMKIYITTASGITAWKTLKRLSSVVWALRTFVA